MKKTKLQNDFWEKFCFIKGMTGVMEYEIHELEEIFKENPTELLPIVHDIYSQEDPDDISYIPYMVLDHFPDFQSIQILLATDEHLTRGDLEEYPGFIEYLQQNEDPFVNRDMSMFEKTPEEKLRTQSLFPKDNLIPGSINKEVLRDGVIRVQYPKVYWKNQKQRKMNSFIDSQGKIFRGAKVLWPADMDKKDIEKTLSWVRSVTSIREGVGIRGYHSERASIVAILEPNEEIYTIELAWEHYN